MERKGVMYMDQEDSPSRWRLRCFIIVMFFTLVTAPVESVITDCPKSCQCTDRAILCNGGQLKDIASAVYFNIPNLQSVILVNISGAQTIQDSHMKSFENFDVTHFTLTKSSVKIIEPGAFQNLTSLETLNLSGNQLSSVDDRLFAGLDQLKSLNLSGNGLAYLGDALILLPGLLHLDLSRNSFQTLPARMFVSQGVLSTLHLDGNPLKNLNTHSFQGLNSLKKLTARDCSLSSIENSVFLSMKKLDYLDLGHNRLSSVPPPGTLSEVIFLRHIYLDNNWIYAVKANHFTGLHLQTLDLSFNPIGEIDLQAFANFSLRELDLSYNKLTTLDEGVFSPLAEHLTVLNLAGNHLREFTPKLFSQLRLLKILNISYCFLDDLPDDIFASQEVLSLLDISGNNLHSLSLQVLNTLSKVEEIKMNDNDWVCDCEIQPFHKWLQKVASTSKLYCVSEQILEVPECSEPVCTAPSLLAGSKIATMDEEQFIGCDPEVDSSSFSASTQGAIVGSCMVFALVLLFVTIYLWKRGKTHKGLRRVCVPSHAPTSHEDEDDAKISPLENCDRASLAMSDHNFVFRHYFEHLVTDPKLMSKTSDSDDEENPSGGKERDSLYSSQPSLYSNHSLAKAAYGMESTV